MKYKALLLLSLVAFAGCTGYGIPSLSQTKPYSYFSGGDQFGRDQLANRWLVAEKKIPIKGKDTNEITTLLGQPQQVQILEHKISEDWYFLYYKDYKTRPKTPEGSFIVRFYQDQVIDVVKLS